jgi:hypothetical protein
MIVVRLNGGLGNQMFQYALGRRLAIERAVPLGLDLGSLNGPARRRARHYGLNAFQIDVSKLFRRSFFVGLKDIKCFGARATRVKEIEDHVLQEFPSDRSLVLDGFWQREEYFSPISEIIRREFQLKAPLTSDRQKIAARLSPSAVSIHVRRGDYVGTPKFASFFGTCSSDWYKAAIAAMCERVQSPHFFVFSDDPVWARKNLPLHGHPAEFIDRCPDNRDYEDMYLMSRCAHHIIANSSFSWWAAWLNPSPDKIVIAPKVWYKGAPQMAAHTLPDWIRI